MFWVISYDIVDDRRRYRVRRALEGYGRRVQYSVFECELEPDRWEKLVKTLTKLIHEKEDNVRFYPLNKAEKERRHLLGTGEIQDVRPYYYVDEKFPF
jgi:CRISPR-associated protein Cas2